MQFKKSKLFYLSKEGELSFMNLTSLKSKPYWDFGSLISAKVKEFRLMNYYTDHGLKENIAILLENGEVIFKSHFKTLAGDFEREQFTAFTISKDINHMITCVSGYGSKPMKFYLYRLDKSSKTYKIVDSLEYDLEINLNHKSQQDAVF